MDVKCYTLLQRSDSGYYSIFPLGEVLNINLIDFDSLHTELRNLWNCNCTLSFVVLDILFFIWIRHFSFLYCVLLFLGSTDNVDPHFLTIWWLYPLDGLLPNSTCCDNSILCFRKAVSGPLFSSSPIKYFKYCVIIHELGHTNPQVSASGNSYNISKVQVHTCSIVAHQCCYMASEQIELLLLISRPSLHWLIIHNEQSLTQLPILVNNTVHCVRLYLQATNT